MSEGAVRGDLPSPEQERAAVLALLGIGLLSLVGAAALVVGIGVALVKTAKWVFG